MEMGSNLGQKTKAEPVKFSRDKSAPEKAIGKRESRKEL
jgi:hypothetical protein